MSDESEFNSVVQALESSPTNIRCAELVEMLERLGFDVRNGSRGGHKIFTHDGIQGFHSGSFNCGHGKNPEIKPAYVRKILRLLNNYKKDIVGITLSGDDK